MKYQLVKMHGCGNDFLFLDCLNSDEPSFFPSEIKHVCDRHFGIGADGLVVILPSESADASWIFYNSDGSEAEMCGNAARCAIRYLHDYYLPDGEVITLETKAGIIRGQVLDEEIVEITLFSQRDMTFDFVEKFTKVNNEIYRVYFINTGVPHAVMEVKELNSFPVSMVGKALVKHDTFGPQGTNVTFFQRLVGNQIMSTTFERGVEKQTLACGTGAAAAAIVYSQLYLEELPISVRVPGGELEIDLSPATNYLLLRGPCEFTFEVEIEELFRDFEPPVLFGTDNPIAEETKDEI